MCHTLSLTWEVLILNTVTGPSAHGVENNRDGVSTGENNPAKLLSAESMGQLE